jgi:hypothetical protein
MTASTTAVTVRLNDQQMQLLRALVTREGLGSPAEALLRGLREYARDHAEGTA